MNYEAMIRETEKTVRDIMFREQIAEWVLWGLCAVLAVLAVLLLWEEHKTVREARAAKVVGGHVYAPVVTEDVQIVNGVEFHRMGVPGRE